MEPTNNLSAEDSFVRDDDGVRKNDPRLPPQCMRDRLNVQADRSPGDISLSPEELSQAKKDLCKKALLKYPKLLKFRVDPSMNDRGQQLYVYSFVPSSGATPDPDGCFGVIKFRGAFPDVRAADAHVEMLLRKVSTYDEFIYGYVGLEAPLTVNGDYCEETKEVDIRKKLDETARTHVRNQVEKQKKDVEDVMERQKKLLADTQDHKEETFDNVEYYTTLRVKLASILHHKDECEKKLGDLTNKLIPNTEKAVREMDSKFPEFASQYMQKYEKALNAIGTKPDANPLIKYMKMGPSASPQLLAPSLSVSSSSTSVPSTSVPSCSSSGCSLVTSSSDSSAIAESERKSGN